MCKITFPIVLLFGAVFMLTACETEVISPENEQPPFVINRCEDSGISVLRSTSGNSNTRIVSIRLRIVGDTLRVDYEPEPGFYINNVSFHVATSPDDIPQGPEAYRNYLYKSVNSKILIPVLTGEQDFNGYLYMAAFANVGRYDFDPSDDIDCEVTRSNSLESNSYFIHTLRSISSDVAPDTLIGQFPAFCLQGDQRMNVGTIHRVKRLSSYSIDQPKVNGVIDNARNMDLVNWLINQDPARWTRPDGRPANGADIQMAIWRLIETTGRPSGEYIQGLFEESIVNQIVSDAQREGQNFVPGCFEDELIILHKGVIPGINPVDSSYNSGNYQNPNYQVSGYVQRIDCEEVNKFFSQGTSFSSSSSDEAQYFAICIN